MPSSPPTTFLRCADPVCQHAATCRRWISLERGASTADPVAGSLMPWDRSPTVRCPAFVEMEDA